MTPIKSIILALLLLPSLALAHSGGVDSLGGHTNRKTGEYHCHREPCLSNHKQAEKAYQEVAPGTYSKLYNRKDWPHWIDTDRDCQNTRQELLISSSAGAVSFTKAKRCTVKSGKWFGVYTGETFNKASDVDIDHIVPLAHAHKSGGHAWARAQRRTFANDPENLLVVDDSTNQAKGAKAPHQWMPPRRAYWCEYGQKWKRIKQKYGLTISEAERTKLDSLNCK